VLSPEGIDAVAKAVIAGLAIAVLAAPGARWKKHRPSLLLALAITSASIYPMRVHARRGAFVHRWEQFHYVVGSRYFPELGYDGLYEAAYAVVARRDPEGAPRHIRDLRSGQVVLTLSIHDRASERLDGFEPGRRAAFERDVDYFVAGLSRQDVVRLFLDHGYNGPPTFTAVAQFASRVGSISDEGLGRFACLDLALVVVMIAALGWAFGRTGIALPLLVATTSMGWHYGWTGGAFLRFDWIAAVVFGVVALSRTQLVLAGVFFAYATAARVFPVVFVVAAMLPWAMDLGRAEVRRDLARFLGGFALALLAFAAIGCAAGRGLDAYAEFASRIAAHRRSWGTNDVGFGVALVADRIHAHRGLIDPRLAVPTEPWALVVGEARAFRAPVVWLVTALVAGYFAVRSRRRPPHEAAVFGVVLLFFATSPANYYWLICLLLPIAAPSSIVSSLLAIPLLLAVLVVFVSSAAAGESVALSFALLGVFAEWLYALRKGAPDPSVAIEDAR